jgi:hypothetical protein
VLHDGTVASCCLDQQSVGESVLGHMDEASIVEIWNGDQARRNRRLHASGRWREVEPCRGCSPVQPPLPLLAGTPLFDALGVKRMTARLERLTRRIPIRLY